MTPTFTSRDFRDSLGLFATGICIATASHGDERVGITINSFASVSMDPPLVLFSVSRALRSFPVFQRADGFAINVLAKDQKDLSTRFSRPGEDKWAGVDAVGGAHGGIVIRPSLATFDCKLHRVHDGGDHLIFVGEVMALESEAVREPLIYFRSNYHEIASGQARTHAA